MGTKVLSNVSYDKVEKLKEKLAKGSNKAYKQLYQVFLSEIDEISSTQLRKLDEIISRYCGELMTKGGWAVGRKDIISHDSKQVTEDYITYRLVRDLDGFHQQPNAPKGFEVGASRESEKRFLQERKVELDVLHRSMLMKDDIIFNRRYTVNPERENLVEELRELLGYNHPETTILPPEGPKVVDINTIKK